MPVDLARGLGLAVASVLAVVALVDVVRRRSLATVEVAAFFCAFAIGVAGAAVGILDVPLVWFAPVALASTALPFLLVRITDHFLAVPPAVKRVALLGVAYSWALNLWLLLGVMRLEGSAATNPTPPPLLTAPMGLYMVGTISLCAWTFVRAALRGSGATTWRARLAALGSLLVALGIAEMVVFTLTNRSETGAPRTPVAALDVYAILLALAAVAFFMAFASPPWLRQMWRLGELHRFLRATAETAIGERGREALDALIEATRRATGATDVVVTTGTASVGGGSAIAVPIAVAGRQFGVLHASFRREPLFPDDDAAIMRLMADQTAVALANAELFRERREIEERERHHIQRELERVEQELELARRIQLSLLPRAHPILDGWAITSYYQPAREVGGDLYDFFSLADGSQGVVIGDASGHGMAAALVMATARAELRAAAMALASPGEVLARANDGLVGAMPPSTFVTCLLISIDARTGRVRYANAGHNVPYALHRGSVRELRARGMPLGLIEGTGYEEFETTIGPEELVFLYTDGIVEAHGTDGRSMFGFGRLKGLVSRANGDPTNDVLSDLRAFTGPAWQQEDDITVVCLRRT